MSLTKYYVMDNSEPQNDSAWLATLGSTISNIIVDITTTGIASQAIKFTVGAVAETNTNYVVDEVTFDISTTSDPNRVQVGDDLYYIDTITDSFATEAITLAIIAAFGFPPLSIAGLAVAGATTYVYSKFLDPITDDVLQTLAGKDMVQFFDAQGNHAAGIIYGDGIPAQNGVAELDAVWAFITNENSAGLDLTGGHIQVDTGLGIDDNYYVYDGAIYDVIANTLGISLIEFRTTQNGGLTNDAYYAQAGHGNYIFFEEDEIEIGIPVTINGQDSVVMVQNVYGNGSVSEANRLIGDDELFEENLVLANGSGTGGDGRDLVIGGTGGDIITGGDDDDILLGNDGNDTIEASEDDDTIDGGDGIDLMDYSVLDAYLDNDVSVNLVLNTAEINYLLNDDDQAIYNVEDIKTGGGADAIVGDSAANIFDTGDGSDTVEGGAEDDTIYGGDGGDRLHGDAGSDSIIGGEGNDKLLANDSHSSNYEIADIDADYLNGGIGNDSLYGGGYDTLIGGEGDDYLESLGNSTLEGGIGDDFYRAVSGDVIIDPDGGNINNIQSVYGHTGEHVWQPGGHWRPFSYDGADLKIYTQLYISAADQFFTIKNYANDGSWGFKIAQDWLDAENDFVIAANGEPSPTNDVFAGGGGGPAASPAPGTPTPDSTNPSIIGNGSNQHEHGYTNSVNHFVATPGFDTQKGGLSDDTYVWGSGNHNDEIVETGGSADRIVLSGLNAADVVAERFGDNVRIRVIATDETLTIKDHYTNAANEVETLEYVDGTTLNLAIAANGMSDINESVSGTSAAELFESFGGEDTIYASHGNDTLVGGLDADTLQGDRHNDTYQWAAGDGNDLIQESGAYNGGDDTLHFTGGITLADLEIYGIGDDVTITYIPTGEIITIEGHRTGTDVETVLFDDTSTASLVNGLTWYGSVASETILATSYDDTLYGYDGADTLDGGFGADILYSGLGDDSVYGDAGDDTYMWAVGDGNDTFIEDHYNASTDTIKMTGGITLSDLDIYKTGLDNHLYIEYIATGETLTLSNHYQSSVREIESITFDDASTVDLVNFFPDTVEGTAGNDSIKSTSSNEILYGYAGNDTLWSMSGEDTLIGGTGNDNLWGSADGDTYVWESGDGNDIIWETYNVFGGDDTLHMTGGIVATDVTFADSGNHLIITHTPTSETIKINYQNHSDPDYHVETLLFDNGTTIDLLGI